MGMYNFVLLINNVTITIYVISNFSSALKLVTLPNNLKAFSDPSLVGAVKRKYVFLRLTLFESHAANYIHSDFFLKFSEIQIT